MNASYLHLVFNHLPLFGALFGTTALVWGLLRANPGLKTAGLVFLLAASIGGWIAHITGEKSEHYVESLEGISRQAVHAHEEAAETTHLFVVPLGALVTPGFLSREKKLSLDYLNPVVRGRFGIGHFDYLGHCGGIRRTHHPHRSTWLRCYRGRPGT